MREYFLEALRETFVEAIAAHKFIEMRYHRNQSDEINRLKRRWKEIKIKLLETESEVQSQYINNLKCSGINFRSEISQIELELNSIKVKVIEQQKLNNQIINQIEKELARIKLINHTKDDFSILDNSDYTFTDTNLEFKDILSELKLMMSTGLSKNHNSEHEYIEVVEIDLEPLRKQLDDL